MHQWLFFIMEALLKNKNLNLYYLENVSSEQKKFHCMKYEIYCHRASFVAMSALNRERKSIISFYILFSGKIRKHQHTNYISYLKLRQREREGVDLHRTTTTFVYLKQNSSLALEIALHPHFDVSSPSIFSLLYQLLSLLLFLLFFCPPFFALPRTLTLKISFPNSL